MGQIQCWWESDSYWSLGVIQMYLSYLSGLYATAEAFFICLAVNLLICNIAVSFGKMKHFWLIFCFSNKYYPLTINYRPYCMYN